MKGLRVADYISSSFPKLGLAQWMWPVQLGELRFGAWGEQRCASRRGKYRAQVVPQTMAFSGCLTPLAIIAFIQQFKYETCMAQF